MGSRMGTPTESPHVVPSTRDTLVLCVPLICSHGNHIKDTCEKKILRKILIYDFKIKNRPESKIKPIISRSSSYVTKWSLRPSLLSQCRQIAANKNLAVFTWRETMSFPCERLLIYNLMSQSWHLIMLFQQLLSNKQGQHTNPPFDEVCLLSNRCYTTFKTLQICLLGSRRWLTGIQWKSNVSK